MFHCLNWHTVKLFFISLAAYIALDFIWILYFMKDFYKEKLSPFVTMGDNMEMIKYAAAFAVWVLIVKGIIIFVLPRSHGSYIHAAVKGAIYGLIVYGSYELTNFAVLANWPTQMVGYDIAWGVFLCSFISVLSLFVAHWCGCEKMLNCEMKKGF